MTVSDNYKFCQDKRYSFRVFNIFEYFSYFIAWITTSKISHSTSTAAFEVSFDTASSIAGLHYANLYTHSCAASCLTC
jgi:hypothetical protein